MKTIVLAHLLNDLSGSPKVLAQVASTLEKHNIPYEVFIASGSQNGFFDVHEKHIHSYFYIRFNNRLLTLAAYFISQFILFLKISLKYRKQKDVIIYTNTMLPFGAALAGKLMGHTVITHIHETSITPKIFKRFLRKLIRLTAHKIIYVSNDLMKNEAFPKQITQTLVYNALPEELLKESSKHSYQPIINNAFNVLMICSLKDYKGVETFLNLSRSTVSKDIHFTLVLNAEQTEINSYLGNQKLSNNITILPKQTSVSSFYKHASLLLNLSKPDQWIETFGLTILEAQAFGVPAIVPPVGGPTEIITDGLNGYLISAYDEEKIMNKVEKLAANPNLCFALSQKAKKNAARFTEGAFQEGIIKVIDT